jgi:hypothetical protein
MADVAARAHVSDGAVGGIRLLRRAVVEWFVSLEAGPPTQKYKPLSLGEGQG